MLKKIILFLILLSSISFAKSYTLFLASTKYIDVAKEYYYDIRFHTPDFYDVVIRTHVKKNYSVIIRQIPTIEKAIKIQKLLHASNKYNDSYIKRFNTEPTYNIINMKKNTKTVKIIEKSYTPEIENGNEYITASIMYNTKQYQEAYDMFFKLFLDNNYNLNINYFLAKSAFKLKKYDASTAAFERVLITKPSFNQARYDYARVLYMLKQNIEAKKQFTQLLDTKITKATKEKIKEYLKILNKKINTQKRISIKAKFLLGFSNSSNVNNGLINSYFNLPGLNNILVEGEKPISDNAHQEMLELTFYKYFKNKPLRLENTILTYNKSFFNEEDENLTIFSYKPSISYFDNTNKNIYNLKLSLDKIIKTTNEDFYSLSISPKINKKNFSSYIKYQRILFEEDIYKEKDFEKIQLFTKVNLFKNINYYLNIYKNKRIKKSRIDIDKNTIGNGINLFYYITKKNKINLNYQFDYSKYKYTNIAFNSKRKDKMYSIEFALTHKLSKNSLINFSISNTNNNSNQDSYVYKNNKINLNYLKTILW